MDRIANFFAGPAMKVVLLAFALIFPLIAGSEYQIYVMALAFIWAIAVYGLNIITGFCGQLNLAHGGFFAIGAYVVAILTVDHGWAFWPAFVAAGVFGQCGFRRGAGRRIVGQLCLLYPSDAADESLCAHLFGLIIWYETPRAHSPV